MMLHPGSAFVILILKNGNWKEAMNVILVNLLGAVKIQMHFFCGCGAADVSKQGSFPQ